MILNNYYNMAANMANIVPVLNEMRNTDIGVINMSGNAINVTTGWHTNFPAVIPTMIQNWNPRARLSMRIGSGNTDPTAGDYSLDNDITSYIANFSSSLQTSADGNKIKTIATMTGSNTTGHSITINEIGVVKTVEKASSGTSPDPDYALMVRYVLDAPKVVANGESFSFSFEWVEE